MIRATIYQDSRKKITGFQIQGHAGYSESGSDIVCAAVSVLAQNTVNSIEQLTKDPFTVEIEEESGSLYFTLESKYSKAAALLLDSLILGLQGIEEEYREYVDVTFEEV